MTVLTEKPPIQLPREKPMFTKLVSKSRGAIVMAGVAALIGLGVAEAPSSLRPHPLCRSITSATG
jgi:hypothetical protein